jgi:hypothetical protein
MKIKVLFTGRIYLNGGFLKTLIKKQFSRHTEIFDWKQQNFRLAGAKFSSGWNDFSVGRPQNFRLRDWSFPAVCCKNGTKSSNHFHIQFLLNNVKFKLKKIQI